MKCLLDTNVVSELRKAKTAKINPHVKLGRIKLHRLIYIYQW